jgi:AraC-like DNA-binding protein
MSTLKNNRSADSIKHSQNLWILDLNPVGDTDHLSYSIQPNLGPEAGYHACVPSLGLKNIVSYYHQIHANENTGEKRIYPSGNIALVFRCDALNPNVYLVGTPTVPRKPEYIEEGHDYFIVFFCIGEGSDLMPVPASELVDTHVPMDRLDLGEVEKIALDIAGKKTFTERVNSFERFLVRQESIINHHHGRLKPVIETICGASSAGSRERLAHLSDRHMRRLFNRYVGVSPAYFKRIVRHQKAIKALNGNPYQDLAGLSAKFGYCDQSHFIHEFKRFHGMSPVRFLKTYIRRD